MSKKKTHYVSNKEFLSDFVEYKRLAKEAEAAGKPKPRLSDAIGKKIMLIAERLSYKPNFINYSYRDEMVDDAIENCVMYADNFDPDKSNNPFGYFTQICYFAFIRRIQKEKKLFFTKVRYVQRSGAMLQQASTQSHDDDCDFSNQYLDYMRDFYEVDLDEKDEEQTPRKKRATSDTVDLTEVCDG